METFTLLAFLQKALGMASFRIEVVHVDIQRKTDFLDLHHMLVLSRFLFPLCLFKTVLSIVHNAADRRRGRRGDLHQIQILLKGDLQRLFRRHDTQLGSVRVDDAHLSVPDIFVDLQFLAANG